MQGKEGRQDPAAEPRSRVDETRSIIDTAHEAFISMDAGGFITDWNPQAEITFGWSRNEAIGAVLADLIIPERYREQHWSGLKRFIATGEGPVIGHRLELEALHREGFEFPVEMTISTSPAAGTSHFNAFLHDITERRRAAQYLDAQLLVTRLLAEAESVEELIPSLLSKLAERMQWDFAGYWVPDESAESLLCADARRAPRRPDLQPFVDHSKSVTLRPGEGLLGRVWAAMEPTFVADVLDDPNFLRRRVAAEVGLHAAIATPLLDRDRCVGVVEWLSAEIGRADEKLADTMRSIGAQVGQHIGVLGERRKMVERLDAMARTDQLTGILNRRGWDEGLARELSRAARSGQPLCLALLDLDGFKEFNDRHGHLAGDRALTELADAWAAELRASDLLARYGGEEFTLALPALQTEGAVATLERLRRLLPGDLTCSGGVARWDGAESAEELLGRADAALYDAKRAGRDRIATASP